MISRFDEAVILIFKHEGGYVNDPRDAGGETKYGISKRAYPTLDIANLTKAQAGEVYFRDYWQKIKGDQLPQAVALFVFDTAVNMGVRRAAKHLQKLCKATPDGVIGPMTLDAVTKSFEKDPYALLEGLYSLRQNLYERLKTFPVYGKGWSRRNIETLEEAIKWIETS